MGRSKLHPYHQRKKHEHQQEQVIKDVPKGSLAIIVGHQGEEQQRFVIPVMYFNHPLFMQLLKEAEEEYGFEQKGTITIPCPLDEFRIVRAMIEKDHHVAGCFRVWEERKVSSL